MQLNIHIHIHLPSEQEAAGSSVAPGVNFGLPPQSDKPQPILKDYEALRLRKQEQTK